MESALTRAALLVCETGSAHQGPPAGRRSRKEEEGEEEETEQKQADPGNTARPEPRRPS